MNAPITNLDRMRAIYSMASDLATMSDEKWTRAMGELIRNHAGAMLGIEKGSTSLTLRARKFAKRK